MASALAASAFVEAAVEIPRAKRLALFFPTVPVTSSVDLSSISDVFAPKIAAALGTAVDAVKFTGLFADSKYTKGSFATFALLAPYEPIITDSLSEGYEEAVKKWSQALLTDDELTKAVSVQGVEVKVDTVRYHAVAPGVFEGDDFYVEGVDPTVELSTERNDLLTALLTRSHVLQVRVPDFQYRTLATSPEALLQAYNGLRKIAASVLGLAETRVVLYDIRDSKPGALFQFSIYPSNAEELQTVEEKWVAAVKEQNSALKAVFPSFDPDFEPRAEAESPSLGGWHEIDQGTGETHVDTSRGIVAGSVIGCVAIVAAIGGAGGYLYKKKGGNNDNGDDDELLEYQHNSTIAAASVVDRYGEIDIADDDGNGTPPLSNVDIGPPAFRAH